MSAFGRVKLFGKLATRNNKVDSHTVASLTGTPEQLLEERTARIFRPSRSTMQSGSLKTKVWKLQFDKEGMWRSPLMGWTGSGDPVQALSFEFKTKEEAITQAEQLGIFFFIVLLIIKVCVT